MGKKRNAASANLDGQGDDAGARKSRKKASEVREATSWQEHVRNSTPTGKARFGDAPKDRARTHALYAVQKAEQAYMETQGELEKRGRRTPPDCRLPLSTCRGGLR